MLTKLPEITSDEWLQISRALEIHHALFYKLWKLGGKLIFTDETETACVEFDNIGDVVAFKFNPTYWLSLDFYSRLFVICHECLHSILNHGTRVKDALHKDLANIAADLVVNHLLVRSFGFDREKVKDWKKLCWVDTAFKKEIRFSPGIKKKPLPKTDETYEHYYALLPKYEFPEGGLGHPDDHSSFGDAENIESDRDLVGKMDSELTPEEKKTLGPIIKKHFKDFPPKDKSGKRAGVGTGTWTFINVGKVRVKKKWETVIKKWARKYLVEDVREVEQWARLNRRMTCLPSDMFLPSEMEHDDLKEEKHKIDVFFFLDTSGSCWGLKDRFFKAAKSLPPERFNIRLFCFDTEVRETTLESGKIYGGGGTSFDIIENAVLQHSQNKYPQAVFIITDGMGSSVVPKEPKKWYWFLSDDYRDYVPNDSHVFMLNDFE